MLIEIDKQEMRLRLDPGEDPNSMELAVRQLATTAGFGVYRRKGCVALTWAFGSISDAWVEVEETLNSVGIRVRTKVVAAPPPRSRSPL